MAQTKVFDDSTPLSLGVASTVVSEDPVLVGEIVGVALTDYRASDGKATVATRGVFNLSVKGVNDAGNVAVAAGDALYFVSGDTPKISKKKSGAFFGYAMAAVTSGATATIAVLLPAPTHFQRGFYGAGMFISAETTGTGSSQNVAHGLGVVPSKVVVVPTEFASNLAYDYAAGSHDATNAVVTVTSGAKFVVMAWV